MEETNPTARALRCLEALQDHPGITADRLGHTLGVSARAARRYVAILREAGIPVESVRGPYGGYRVGRGLRPAPLRFTATEALALVMAVLDGHHDAADAGDPVGAALGKLVRVLPESVAAQAETMRRTASPVPDRAAARPDPQTAVTLVQACADRRRLRLHYRTEAGSDRVMEVDPWAVVIRHGRWYLLCWSHTAHDRRVLRVDRIGAVQQLVEDFTPPADLDPATDLEAHLAVGWEYDVDVIVEASTEAVARCLPRSLGRLEALDGERCRLSATTGNPYWYAEQLARLPGDFRVVGGPELRQVVHTLGRRLLAAGAS
ncbi:MAG: WYL domain-containing protein [Kineosporiaceae bacterium]